jgi:hypothetical protein
MTDHVDVPIVATGDWIDAAWINQFIGDNNRAWQQAYTAAGMMAYALDANTLAGLAAPAVLSLFQHDGSAPSFLAKGTAHNLLRMNSIGTGFEFAGALSHANVHTDVTGHNYSSAAWRDMPNSSFNIDLVVTSTIICGGIVTQVATDSPNFYGYFESYFKIDGTEIPWMKTTRQYGALGPAPVFGLKHSVPAGTRTIMLRESCPTGSYHVDGLFYFILVVPDGTS